MVLSVKASNFDIASGTGTQNITGVGFQPKLVLLLWTGCDGGAFTENQAVNPYMTLAAGASSSQRWVIGGNIEQGVTAATTNSYRWLFSNKIGYAADTSGSAFWDYDLTSLDSDGFTINKSTASASDRLAYLALGGDSITDVKVGTIDLGAGSSQGFTGIGFQPDLLLFATSVFNTTESAVINNTFGFGAATSSDEAAFTHSAEDTPSILTDCIGGLLNNCCIYRANTSGGVSVQANLVSMDSDGFTLNRTVDDGNTCRIGYIAIKGSLQLKIGVETQKTSTGTKATTGVGFQPAALIAGSACRVNSSSLTAGVRSSIGFADGSDEACGAICSENAQTTSRGARSLKQKTIASIVNSAGTASTQVEANLDSFDSDGFTLDWTSADATAREFFYIALASDSVSNEDADDTLTFTEDVDVNFTVNKTVNDTIVYTDEAQGLSNAKNVDDTLSYTELAAAKHVLYRVSENIVFSDSASSSITYERESTDNLVVFEVAEATRITPASDLFEPEDEVEVETRKYVEDELDITETITFQYVPHNDFLNELLELEEEALGAAVRSKSITDPISYGELLDYVRVKYVTSSDIFIPYDVASSGTLLNADDTLTITDDVEFSKIIHREIDDEYLLTEVLTRVVTFNCAASDALNVTEGSFKSINLGQKKLFWVPGVLAVKTQRVVTLEVASSIVVLPRPLLGNTEAKKDKLIVKRAIDSEKYTYVKRKNTTSLKYKFQISRRKARELENFVFENLNELITMKNWRGEIWIGFIMNNPFEFKVTKRRGPGSEEYEFDFDFEGIKVN